MDHSDDIQELEHARSPTSRAAELLAMLLRRLASNAYVQDAINDTSTEVSGSQHKALMMLGFACSRLSFSDWYVCTWTLQEHIVARQSLFAFGHEVIDVKSVILGTARA